MNDPAAPIPTSDPIFGALVLAGGLSSRMGADKASLPYKGRTLLEHMRTVLARAGAAPILTGGGPRADIEDPVALAGPVSSLCALARRPDAAMRRWVVVPVDMPLLEPGLLRRLAREERGAFFEGHPLPLALTMDQSARAVLERAETRIKAGESVSVHEVLAELGAAALRADPDERAQLVNANTPEEWARMTRGDK